MTRAALTLALVAGCVPGPVGVVQPLTAADVAARDDAETAWLASEPEPLGGECASDRDAMRVIVAGTHREMFTLTGYCGPSDERSYRKPTDHPMADGTPTPWPQWQREDGDEIWCRWGRRAGVYRRAQDGGAWPFALAGYRWPALVIWHSYGEAERLRLVRHESFHWIGECAAGDPDHDHEREIWR